MVLIKGARPYASLPSSSFADPSPHLPFSIVELDASRNTPQLTCLRRAMEQVWRPTAERGDAAPLAPLGLQNTGLLAIHSSARLIPRWIGSVWLDDNPYLNKLPNDLPDQLRWLSVRNNTSLRQLPDSLPRGLTVEVAGSALTLEYLRCWMARHPHAGVTFTNDGTSVEPDRGPSMRDIARRARENWQARTDFATAVAMDNLDYRAGGQRGST